MFNLQTIEFSGNHGKIIAIDIDPPKTTIAEVYLSTRIYAAPDQCTVENLRTLLIILGFLMKS